MNHRPASTLTRFAATLLVMVYAFNLPSIAPFLWASAMALGGGHQHQMEVAFDHGHLDIVLHHHGDDDVDDHGEPTGPAPVARTHEQHPDHVLHFTNSSSVKTIASARMNVSSPMVLWVTEQDIAALPSLRTQEVVAQKAPRPPPTLSSVIRCLRTTVLLV